MNKLTDDEKSVLFSSIFKGGFILAILRYWKVYYYEMMESSILAKIILFQGS
jgi:hypothetical protein